MKDYVVKYTDTVIYGVTNSIPYELLGKTENGCAIIRDNMGELVEINQDHIAFIFDVDIKLSKETQKMLKRLKEKPMKVGMPSRVG